MDEESTWLLSIGPASVKTAHRSCCEIVGPRFWMRIVRIGLGWVAVGVGVCTGVSMGVDVPLRRGTSTPILTPVHTPTPTATHPSPIRTILIQNLGPTISQHDLCAVFTEAGPIESSQVDSSSMACTSTSTSTTARITYTSAEAAKRAVAMFNSASLGPDLPICPGSKRLRVRLDRWVGSGTGTGPGPGPGPGSGPRSERGSGSGNAGYHHHHHRGIDTRETEEPYWGSFSWRRERRAERGGRERERERERRRMGVV